MEYELQADGELAATLRFRSAWNSLATAESAEGKWIFNRVGFWRPKIIIQAQENEVNLAVLQNNSWSNGGTLELSDGRRYLTRMNSWNTQYEIRTEGGESLLKFKIKGSFRKSADVEVFPAMTQVSEIPWLVLFGWYQTVMINMDAAAIAAAMVPIIVAITSTR
ncbi:MAG: hypothetical protein ABI904_22345 [Chloroflexota bacterium]